MCSLQDYLMTSMVAFILGLTAVSAYFHALSWYGYRKAKKQSRNL